MNYVEAALFGALQGVAEFLPVSSSGHLAFLKVLLGFQDVPLLFDVILHIATLLVVFVVFRVRIIGLFAVLGRILLRRSTDADKPGIRLIIAILIATACTGVIGIFLKDLVSDEQPKIISALFLATAGILIAASRFGGRKGYESIGAREAVITGIAQGIGVFPGISRSGITISASLASGMSRQEAGEYSFLLSIPAILGALVLTLKDGEALGSVIRPDVLAVGFLSAVIVGYISLKFLLKLVRSGKLAWFALYLVPLGIWGLFVF